MAIFNSYVKLPEGKPIINQPYSISGNPTFHFCLDILSSSQMGYPDYLPKRCAQGRDLIGLVREWLEPRHAKTENASKEIVVRWTFQAIFAIARGCKGFFSFKLSNTSGQCKWFQGIRQKRVVMMHTDVPKPPSLTRRVALHEACLLGSSALPFTVCETQAYKPSIHQPFGAQQKILLYHPLGVYHSPNMSQQTSIIGSWSCRSPWNIMKSPPVYRLRSLRAWPGSRPNSCGIRSLVGSTRGCHSVFLGCNSGNMEIWEIRCDDVPKKRGVNIP